MFRRRYRVVRQTDENDCGPAALATIALWHRRPIARENLLELTGADRAGANLLGLVRAADRLGFAAKAVKGPLTALPSIPTPAIAHTSTEEGRGHFVVLFRVGKNHIVVGDPASGVERQSLEHFGGRWSGHLVLLAPHDNLQRGDEGEVVAPCRRLLGLLSVQRSVLAEACACALLMTLLGVVSSYFIQHLVDSVLARGETSLLGALGVAMAAVVIFRTAFGVLRQYLLAHVGRKVDLLLVAAYARHLLALPLTFFEMRRVGEIVSRVGDAAKVRDAVSGATLTVVVDGLLVSVTSVVLWCYDAQLAFVATLFAPVLAVSVLSHQPLLRRRSRAAMEEAAQLSAHMVEDVSGIETIKALGLHDERLHAGEQRLVKVAQSGFSLQKLQLSMSALGALTTGLAGVAVLWCGGHRVAAGALTIGELMFFYTLLGYLLTPLERLASVNLQIQDALVAVDRLYQIMDLPPEPRHRGVKLSQLDGPVVFDNVSFRYGNGAEVLRNISLTIPVGATIAAVGESGCGKSTLIKLLMRFYEPTSGRITASGVDLRDLDAAAYRERIGYVSQEPYLFNATIEANLTAGAPSADWNDVLEAVQFAGMEEFIASLPNRYQTLLGDRGANLSGGQRQRLAIARALVRRPNLLIFDEATSHLDTNTERAIQNGLRAAAAETTALLVAHRLSTVCHADCIYVMHRGGVAEYGTHDQLLARGGRYASLWRAQAASAPLLKPNGGFHNLMTRTSEDV